MRRSAGLSPRKSHVVPRAPPPHRTSSSSRSARARGRDARGLDAGMREPQRQQLQRCRWSRRSACERLGRDRLGDPRYRPVRRRRRRRGAARWGPWRRVRSGRHVQHGRSVHHRRDRLFLGRAGLHGDGPGARRRDVHRRDVRWRGSLHRLHAGRVVYAGRGLPRRKHDVRAGRRDLRRRSAEPTGHGVLRRHLRCERPLRVRGRQRV